MTYLELVNNVLLRLRERQVGTVNENAYSQLIGQFVNDAVQEVEQAWDWSSLRTTLSATTSSGVFSYELNTAGTAFEILNVINDTSNDFMEYRTSTQFDDWYLNSTPASGAPKYYSWNGVANDGDVQVDIYPKPDGVYSLRFNMIKRSPEMTSDSTDIIVPYKGVQLLAYAKAVEERGEDGGQSAQGAYRTAERAISDAIALDSARHPEELIYAPV
jgi:hypothetical protein